MNVKMLKTEPFLDRSLMRKIMQHADYGPRPEGELTVEEVKAMADKVFVGMATTNGDAGTVEISTRQLALLLAYVVKANPMKPNEIEREENKAYVLAPKTEFLSKWQGSIKGGSAIVGVPYENGMFKIYYEGNLYGAENLKTLKDRAIIAFGRLAKRYPTVACCSADESEFEIVGQVGFSFFDLQKSEALDAWLALDPELVS